MSTNIYKTSQKFFFHWANYLISIKGENGFTLLYFINDSLMRFFPLSTYLSISSYQSIYQSEAIKSVIFLNRDHGDKNSGDEEKNLSYK